MNEADYRNSDIEYQDEFGLPLAPADFEAAQTLPDHQERSIIARAIEEYHKSTCIRFVPRSNEIDFVFVTRREGCFSMIGRDGGQQLLSLGDGCMFVGIIIHEFMHAVGFWHEQSRADRDNYVTIMWENIQQGQTHNFAKYTDGRLHHLNEAYDYNSIMHYGPYDFTKYRNRPTILPKQRNVMIGQRSGFSQTDVRKINKLYQCGSLHKETCEDTDSQCRGWAELGECKKNPKWMHTNCRRSCNQCPDINGDWSAHSFGRTEPTEDEGKKPSVLTALV
ncbi:unnamed protein product [Larinioides sclopetarius]|uniref:Metalloendopeptidase n=1 Tax=Larinioides sclopetarius TaxID=280406 RepID=A0AAV1YTG3_9ARAC